MCRRRYNMQVSHVYHFSHALLDDDTENLMAEGMPASKDTTQTGASKLYTGAEAYRGRGRKGSPSAEAAFPANAPFLESTMTFFLAPEALDDVMHCKSQYWVPNRAWAKERLDTFRTFNVTWDYSLVGGSSGQLLLEPGYLYTLKAVSKPVALNRPKLAAPLAQLTKTTHATMVVWLQVVSVHPYFTPGRLEMVWIDNFAHKVLSTSVERVRTDYFHRREAQVTYAIGEQHPCCPAQLTETLAQRRPPPNRLFCSEFDIGAMEWTIAHNYPLSAFISDVCALTVVMALGSWFLKHYHNCRNIPHRLVEEHFGRAVQPISAEQAAIDMKQDQEDEEQQEEIDQNRAQLRKQVTQLDRQAADIKALQEQLAKLTATSAT
jgi:hypothetical protein